MNKYISLILMQKLLGLPYIDKAGGVVQIIQKVIPSGSGDKSIVKRIPISAVHQAPEGCDLTEAISIHFIPEEKLKGMFYFEDNGVSVDGAKTTTSLTHWRSRLRLVVWLNQKLLTETYDITLVTRIMNEMINTLLVKGQNLEVLKLFTVEVSAIPPATSSLFSDYDYDEKENQFLMPPFDFFAVDLDITFGIAKGCIVPVIPETDLSNC